MNIISNFCLVCSSKKKTKNEACCICYEIKEITLSCYFCLDGNVCCDCAIKLSEESSDKCPICRQMKWKKCRIKKTKIIPTNVQSDVEPDKTFLQICEEWYTMLHRAWRVFFTVLGILATVYGTGVLTIVVLCSQKTIIQLTPYIWFLALFVGMFEYFIIWFCCCCKGMDQ